MAEQGFKDWERTAMNDPAVFDWYKNIVQKNPSMKSSNMLDFMNSGDYDYGKAINAGVRPTMQPEHGEMRWISDNPEYWKQQDYRKMTKDYEGFRPAPYLDTRGIPTIGYGFNMQTGKYPNRMDRAQADEIFNSLYEQAQERAATYLGMPYFEALPPRRKAIVTDMAYNLGNRLNQFKGLKKAIIEDKPEDVRKEMIHSKWYKQVGNRSKAHVKNW